MNQWDETDAVWSLHFRFYIVALFAQTIGNYFWKFIDKRGLQRLTAAK